MTPKTPSRKGLLILVASIAALLAGLLLPYPVHRTHGQSQQFVSTYTYDPASAQLTVHLTINDPSVLPLHSIAIEYSSVNIQSLLQAPPGCMANPLNTLFFVDCDSPPLQLGVDYIFVFQVAAGSTVSGPLHWIASQISGNNVYVYGFTSQPAPLPTPTVTPLPTSTPTPLPPTATATATATPTLTPTPTATPLPPTLAIDAVSPLHVGRTVMIRIRVREKDTQAPVAGAVVTLNGRSVGIGRIRHATTDDRGVAVFRKVRPVLTGVLHISATKEGFTASKIRVQVRP